MTFDAKKKRRMYDLLRHSDRCKLMIAEYAVRIGLSWGTYVSSTSILCMVLLVSCLSIIQTYLCAIMQFFILNPKHAWSCH